MQGPQRHPDRASNFSSGSKVHVVGKWEEAPEGGQATAEEVVAATVAATVADVAAEAALGVEEDVRDLPLAMPAQRRKSHQWC
jgi:hypothetical protein